MKEYTLEEKDGHVVSFSEHGNPDGPAILSFHGGPGSKSKPSHAARFDLAKYRVILFDQRGCGKSTPLGCLTDNTTNALIEDVERIREKLNIDSWFVSGASWGAGLALVYAIRHASRIRGILISSAFFIDRKSVEWMTGPHGAARLMPDVWEKRMEFFAKFGIRIEHQNEDIAKAFERANEAERKEIAAGVMNWEGNLFSSQSGVMYKKPEEINEEDAASARMFIHYETNECFLPDNYVLDNAKIIAHIPTVLVHGRYDIVCPLDASYAFAKAMNDCELVTADESGHRLTAEGQTIQKMAFDRFLEKHV